MIVCPGGTYFSATETSKLLSSPSKPPETEIRSTAPAAKPAGSDGRN